MRSGSILFEEDLTGDILMLTPVQLQCTVIRLRSKIREVERNLEEAHTQISTSKEQKTWKNWHDRSEEYFFGELETPETDLEEQNGIVVEVANDEEEKAEKRLIEEPAQADEIDEQKQYRNYSSAVSVLETPETDLEEQNGFVVVVAVGEEEKVEK